MLKVNCDVCHKEINEPGGLLFSPPDKITGSVWKYHICNSCYSQIAHDLFMKRVEQPADESCDAKVMVSSHHLIPIPREDLYNSLLEIGEEYITEAQHIYGNINVEECKKKWKDTINCIFPRIKESRTGYNLDYTNVQKHPGYPDPGCEVAEVPKEELRAALVSLGEEQTRRLQQAGLDKMCNDAETNDPTLHDSEVNLHLRAAGVDIREPRKSPGVSTREKDINESQEVLKSCEQCGFPAWDGYICHECGLKKI